MRTLAKLSPLCLALLVFAASAQTPQEKPRPPERKPRPGVKEAHLRIPMTKLKPDQVFEIPGVPDWIVIDEHVWVSNSPRNSVARIDPKANKIVDTITVGKAPCSGIAAGFGGIWVPNCGDKNVSRIDITSGKVAATLPVTIGNSEGGLATGAGSVWIMTDDKGTLARIDPDTNKVVAEIYIAPGSYTVAFADNTVWVTSTERSLLTRINAHTNVVEETIKVGGRPRFLAVGRTPTSSKRRSRSAAARGFSLSARGRCGR